MKDIKIISNKIKCNYCGDIIESEYTHDFKYCSCKRVFVDGGHEYMRRGFQKKEDYTELSEYREKTYLEKEKEREENRLRELREREEFLRIVNKVLHEENKND